MGQIRARKPEEMARRRQDILDETAKIFLQEDYNDISMGAIAKQLKITRPALYHYFPSKEDLFLALMKDEYLACHEDMQSRFTVPLAARDFCRQLVEVIAERPLFVKLLSLHASALEEKVGVETMRAFKTDTLPFFRTLPDIVRQQFPQAKESAVRLFVAQFNLMITTIYQYGHIPEEQVAIMAELETFGSEPLLPLIDFFTESLLALAQPLL